MKKYLKFSLVFCLIFLFSFGGYVLNRLEAAPSDGGVLTDPTKKAEVFCVRISSTTVGPDFHTARVIIGFTKRVYYKPNAAFPTKDTLLTFTKPGGSGTYPTFYLLAGSTANALRFDYVQKVGDGVSPENIPSVFHAENKTLDLSFIKGQDEIMLLEDDGSKYYQEGIDWSKLTNDDIATCTFPNTGGDGSFKGVIDPNGGFPGLLGDGYQPQTCPPGTVGTWPNCSTPTGPSCTDGIQNQGETGIDVGGPCGGGPAPTNTGTCADGIQNGNETAVDQGGSCEGGILGQVGSGSNLPPIEHIAGTGKPVLINWQDINLPATWDPYIIQAKKDWNLVRQIRISIGGPGYNVPMNYRDDYMEGNQPAQWIGAASYFVAGGGHQQGTVVDFNKKKMDELGLNTPAYIAFLLCHELGHALGAGHQDVNNYNANKGSCMDYSRQPGGGGQWGSLSNEHPNQVDIDVISNIYNHTH